MRILFSLAIRKGPLLLMEKTQSPISTQKFWDLPTRSFMELVPIKKQAVSMARMFKLMLGLPAINPETSPFPVVAVSNSTKYPILRIVCLASVPESSKDSLDPGCKWFRVDELPSDVSPSLEELKDTLVMTEKLEVSLNIS